MSRILCLLLVVFTVASCFNESSETTVHPELEPFFETFKEAAEARGIEFDNDAEGISGIIRRISGSTIIGQCARSNDSTKIITIDRSFWDAFNDFEKELVVYHELGHCFLNRPHCDVINTDETCFSIMHSSEDLCENNYNSVTREEFLDELFDFDYASKCQ